MLRMMRGLRGLSDAMVASLVKEVAGMPLENCTSAIRGHPVSYPYEGREIEKKRYQVSLDLLVQG